MNSSKFKLLVENLIKEDEASDALKSAFTSPSVEDFVSQFRAIASDPKVQAILRAGATDGNPDDEKVSYSQEKVKVGNLLPTQNEIGFDQSIENIITDQYGSLESILKGNADVGGPIVTYNGKYVIDGHHRWSQVFAANPKASMDAIDLKGKLKPTEMLKVVHAAIAVDIGKVPSSNPKGINILDGVTEKQVSDKVNEKLTPKAKAVWAENGFKDNQAISNHIFRNLETLISRNKPVSGAPGRKDMPQTDQESKPIDKINKLAQGIVNFKDPKSADVQKEIALNESVNRLLISEGLNYHLQNKIDLNESIYRPQSTKFLELFEEARALYDQGKLQLSEQDEWYFQNTELGNWGEYNGVKVPLDFPMTVDFLLEVKSKAKKHPPLNKPHRGGSKKFYVYVRKPGGGVKKVSFGDTSGLSAKINNPKARKSFAARHKCSQAKDKTTPKYWSCRLPRYAKLLGLKSNFSGYW